MRISYKTHPALKFFLKGDKSVVSIDRPVWDAAYIEILDSIWNKLKKYNGDVTVISNSFIEATGKAGKTLGPLAVDVLTDLNQELFIEGIYIVGQHICYINVKKEIGKKDHEIESITIESKSGCIVAHVKSFNDKIIFYPCLGIENEFKTYDKIKDAVYFFDSSCVLFHLFKHYSSVETKNVAAQKKEHIAGEKKPIYNEIDRGILYLDSFWFTELVRSEEFSVRGHFRLQPKKKDGEWTKELIWVDAFLKHGYHRRPQKEIEGY
jgi:hypothetical protein